MRMQKTKAEILSRQYTSVFTQDNPLEPVPDVPYSLPSMPDINIEENGILKLLKEVNVHKAIGPDLIPNRILKDCCVELAPILTQIYTKIIARRKTTPGMAERKLDCYIQEGCQT